MLAVLFAIELWVQRSARIRHDDAAAVSPALVIDHAVLTSAFLLAASRTDGGVDAVRGALFFRFR